MSAEHDELTLAGLYALGALEGEERRAFEAHLATCDECQRELQSMQRVTLALGSGVAARTPPPGLRERVLANATSQPQLSTTGTAKADGTAKPGSAAPPAPVASASDGSRSRQTVAFPDRDALGRTDLTAAATNRPARGTLVIGPLLWLPAAAVLAIAAGLGIYAYGLQGRIAVLEARLEQAETRAEIAERSTSEVQQVAVRAQNAMGVLVSPDMARIDLAGQPAAPVAMARAFWSRNRGLVFTATNLPPLPAGRVYQIWVLTSGAPISAGLVMPDDGGTATAVIQTPSDIPPPAGVAVSLEPAGGVPAPTGAIYLAGKPAIS